MPVFVRRFRWILLILGLACVLVNFIAYQQAYHFTHYAQDQNVRPFESLSLLEKIGAGLVGIDVPRPINHRTPASVGLAYEVKQIDLANEDYLEGWYIPRPDARGLVLLFHGYAGSKDTLLAPALIFHDLSYATFLVDFRGSGGSTGSDTTLGVREGIDVAETVRYAQTKLFPGKPLILYGFSMGSAAILRAIATEHIQPDAIILEHPFDTLLNTIRNRASALHMPAFPTAELLAFWGSVQNGFNGFSLNPVEWASSVKCPVLIFRGSQDVRVTEEQANAVFDHVLVPIKNLIRINKER